MYCNTRPDPRALTLAVSVNDFDEDDPRYYERYRELTQLLIDNFDQVELLPNALFGEELLTVDDLHEGLASINKLCGYELTVICLTPEMMAALKCHTMRWQLELGH